MVGDLFIIYKILIGFKIYRGQNDENTKINNSINTNKIIFINISFGQ